MKERKSVGGVESGARGWCESGCQTRRQIYPLFHKQCFDEEMSPTFQSFNQIVPQNPANILLHLFSSLKVFVLMGNHDMALLDEISLGDKSVA